MFAEIHQDTRDGWPHIFAIKYWKKDGTTGYKARVSKSFRNLPGQSKFRQNVKHNNILLLHNHETNTPFEILIDLIVQYNHTLVDHLT